MFSTKFKQVAVAVVAAFSGFCAQAATTVVDFPSSGSAYHAAINGDGFIPSGGSSQWMWSAGDTLTQTFTGLSLNSVSSLDIDFQIFNVLGSGANETVGVSLNGVNVGSWTALDCNFCSSLQDVHFSSGAFAPIVGNGTYTLQFTLQNTVFGGGGSIAFADGGKATMTGPVPEPETYGLALAGLAVVGALALRRK